MTDVDLAAPEPEGMVTSTEPPGSAPRRGGKGRAGSRPPTSSPCDGGMIYGLGLVGALVWFWRQADGVGGHVTAVLKALVWPALLVYGAFKALRR